MIMISFGVGMFFGDALGVASSYAVMNGLLLSYPMLKIPGRLIDLTWPDMIRNLREIALSSIAMYALVLLVDCLLPDSCSDPVRIGIIVPFGIGSYVFIAWRSQLKTFNELLEILGERLFRIRGSQNAAE